MTSLSTLFGGGDGGGAIDQEKEGYPCVAVYGGDFNQWWDLKLMRVDSGEVIGSPWAAITNSTADYHHGMSHLQTFGYNSDYGQWGNNGFSSQGYSSWESFTMSLYQNDHYPYSWYTTTSPEGRMVTESFHGSNHYQKYHRRINVSMKEGKRPRRQFNVNNNYINETAFSSYWGLKESFDLSSNALGINFTAGRYAGYDNSYGSAAYNQRTNTLAITWGSGDDNIAYGIYKGTTDLMASATIEDWFDNLASYKTGGLTSTGQNFGSCNYNYNMAVSDNDHITFVARSDNDDHFRVYDVGNASQGANISYSTASAIGNTTSYGSSQGMHYRGRYQQTWDAKWGAFYSPYYYYGNGLSCHIFSLENPNKYFKVNLTFTDYGGAFMPSGKSGFKLFSGANTDGQPIRTWSCDMRNVDTNPSNNSNYIGTANYTAQSTINNYSNGQTLDNSISDYDFQRTGWHYSTSYNRFASVNWWPVHGGLTHGA
jgi:hypothetical protein